MKNRPGNLTVSAGDKDGRVVRLWRNVCPTSGMDSSHEPRLEGWPSNPAIEARVRAAARLRTPGAPDGTNVKPPDYLSKVSRFEQLVNDLMEPAGRALRARAVDRDPQMPDVATCPDG